MSSWRKALGAAMVMAVPLMASGPSLAANSADPLSTPAIMSPLTLHLHMMDVAKAGSRLVSVGVRGTILVSDNQGKSWRQVPCPVSVALTSVAFYTKTDGIAVGHDGVVLASHDGGLSWNKVMDGLGAAKIELAAAKADYAKEPPKIAKRRLGEAKGLVTDGPDKPFLDVHFLDGDHGLMVGAYGLAFRTDDGGKTWTSLIGATDNIDGWNLYAVAQAPGAVYLAGEKGFVYKSTDGGHTFAKVTRPAKGTLFGILVTKTGAVITYGLRGELFRSDDGGKSWTQIKQPPASILVGKVLADGTVILVDETGRALISHDDGKTFASQSLPVQEPYTGLVEVAPHTLVLAGVDGDHRVTLPLDHKGASQ